MAYEKRTWVSGTTPCSSENFNHMEQGIADAHDKIDELNTKIYKDISDQFNWGTCTECKVIQIGKMVFFQAQCNTKASTAMTFASLKDTSLYPVTFTMLNAYAVAGADVGKKATAYINTSGAIVLQTYDSYTSPAAAAWSGACRVSGFWIIA